MKKKVAVIWVTAVVITIILLLTYLAIQYTGEKLLENSITEGSNAALVSAQNMASNIEVDVISTHDELLILSESTQIRSGTPFECQKKIDEITDALGDNFQQIGRMNAQGVFDCSVNRNIIGANALELYPHIKAMYNDPEHKPTMSSIIHSPDSQQHIIAISIPLYDETQFTGALGIALYLDSFGPKYFSDATPQAKGYFAVWDEKGDVIYHPDKTLIGINALDTAIQGDIEQREAFKEMIQNSAEGKAGVARYTFRGEERIAGYSPANVFGNRHWTVINVVPLSEIALSEKELETQRRLRTLFIINILLAIVGSALVILYAIRSFFNPVERLTEQIEELSKGKLDIQIDQDIKQKQDEIGNLARSFDRILLSLKLAIKKVGLTKEELQLGTVLEEKKHIEQELKKTEGFVENILEHAGIPVMSYSKEGHLMIANKELLKFTQYTKEDLLTRDKMIEKFFPGEEPKKKFKDAIQEFYRGKEVKDFVIPIFCKNRKTNIIVANIAGIRNEKGEIIGEVIFMRDLSKIFELEYQIRHWAANGFVQNHEEERKEHETKRTSNIEISNDEKQTKKK